MTKAETVIFRPRWRLKATLVLRSPLTVATGALEEAPRGADGEDRGSVAGVERDVHGRPYIPGTSLKGVMRAWCVERFPDRKQQIEALFGHEPRDKVGQSEKVTLGGIAEFHDALASELPATETALPSQGSTAIDRKTGTAERRKLRHTELVPAGTRFALEVTGDGLGDDDAGMLVAALRAFARDEVRIGGDTGTGRGLATVEGASLAIAKLEAAHVAAWLEELVPGSWHEWLERHGLTVALDDLTVPDPEEPPATLRLRLELAFDGPCLVSAEYPKQRQGDPDRVPTEAGYGRPYLPGSSVKGALRAQAQRIADTVGAGMESVRRLFGSLGSASEFHRGALTIGDFLPSDDSPLIAWKQDFVAIDRFMGGAAEQKKFATTFLDSPCFTGSIELRLSVPAWPEASGKLRPEKRTDPKDLELQPEDIGLLALLLRDLAEGDIRFGYGTTKGYGACRIASATVETMGDVDGRLAEILPAAKACGALPSGTIGDAAAAFAGWKPAIAAAIEKLAPAQKVPAHG